MLKMSPCDQSRLSVSVSSSVCIVLCCDGIYILFQLAVLLCVLCLRGGESVINCNN